MSLSRLSACVPTAAATLACVLLLGATPSLYAQEQITCEKPLGEQDVGKLLMGEVPQARVKQYLATCGIDFDLTPEVEQRLRQLGATDGVILALRRAPRPDPAQKILHRAIEAMGGLDALRNLRSLVMVLAGTRVTPQGKEETVTERIFLTPDKVRFDSNYPSGTTSTIVRGERAWRKSSTNIQELPASDAKGLRADLENWTERLLLAAAQGDRSAELLGPGVVHGREVELLLLTQVKPPDGSVDPDNPGNPIKLYIEKTTGRIVKRADRRRNSSGTFDEREITYSDFRRVGSLIKPFSVVIFRNGNKESELVMESCEVNAGVDPSVFSVEGQPRQPSTSQNALLTGSVYAGNGDPIPGATVRLHNPGTGWVQTATTDASGSFTFLSVPPGENYVVSVEKPGFATATRPGLTLKPNESKLMVVPFELQPAIKPAALSTLTLQEVLSLLEAGVNPVRVATLVHERGVGFDLTTDAEGRLRAAGATDELLLAIAKNRK